MQKNYFKSIISVMSLLIILLFSSTSMARFGAGGGGVGAGGFGAVGVGGGHVGGADFRGVDNVGYRGYDRVNVNRNVYDVNRVNVYDTNRNVRGRYYYNGVYYNNCEVIQAHWQNGIWYPASQNCW